MPVDGWEFGLPAGLMDAGETAETCAARELREETGPSVYAYFREADKC